MDQDKLRQRLQEYAANSIDMDRSDLEVAIELKPRPCVCECGRVCEDAPRRTHSQVEWGWRTTCHTCKMMQNPITDEFDIQAGQIGAQTKTIVSELRREAKKSNGSIKSQLQKLRAQLSTTGSQSNDPSDLN